MNRQIKFRAKRSDIGEWAYGSLTTQKLSPRFQGDYCIFDGAWHVIDSKTIGQFTGLRDTNGTEIYEGDIVSNGKHKGTVKWMQGKCCFQIAPGGFFLSKSCIVLGNIHDNPDLLKEDNL